MGRANERIAGIQESYIVNASSYWLEGLERQLAMMKEYQVRRLFYVISQAQSNTSPFLGRTQEA